MNNLTISPVTTELMTALSWIPSILYHQKLYTHEDTNGRRIKIASAHVESEHSYTRDSFISIGTLKTVGRVIGIFNHHFSSRKSCFLNVSWFDGPYKCTSSTLQYVLADEQKQSVVPIEAVPLVTAQPWMRKILLNFGY